MGVLVGVAKVKSRKKGWRRSAFAPAPAAALRLAVSNDVLEAGVVLGCALHGVIIRRLCGVRVKDVAALNIVGLPRGPRSLDGLYIKKGRKEERGSLDAFPSAMSAAILSLGVFM